MEESASIEDGQRASVAIQTLIMKLLEQGLDPRSIALMSCSIGSAMLIDHYGPVDGAEICTELTEKAKEGQLPTFPALKATNENSKK